MRLVFPRLTGGRLCTVSAMREKENSMYQYVEKGAPTDYSSYQWVKQAPTVEALYELCKQGEVARVIIPQTWYGYGASVAMLSNHRSIKHHYRENKLKDYGTELSISSYQFLKHPDMRDMIRELQEQYPIFNEQDYSELETETLLEFLVDEISYVLIDDETDLWPETLYETKELVKELLESGEWDTRIEYWEYCRLDNDGATPYSEKTEIEELAKMITAKRVATK
jgi:hypothetical protein